MKVPVLFPKIFDYPFTYNSNISENLSCIIYLLNKSLLSFIILTNVVLI